MKGDLYFQFSLPYLYVYLVRLPEKFAIDRSWVMGFSLLAFVGFICLTSEYIHRFIRSIYVCVSDALTHCQKRQSEALSIMSHAPVIGQFVPRCQSDGRYERIQCHGGSGQCWCVDRNGIELPGTAVRGGQPDCSVKGERGG